MSSAIYNIVRAAILSRQQVIATYKGHVRRMCPHVIGLKNGKEQALFYQFGGTSSSGQVSSDSTQNWRCIPIDGLTDVEVRSGDWQTAANRSRPQTCVDEVDVEVDV